MWRAVCSTCKRHVRLGIQQAAEPVFPWRVHVMERDAVDVALVPGQYSASVTIVVVDCTGQARVTCPPHHDHSAFIFNLEPFVRSYFVKYAKYFASVTHRWKGFSESPDCLIKKSVFR